VAELRGYRGPQVTAEQLAEEVSMDKRSSYRVLDVGAGTGLVAEELNKLGFLNIDALEPSADMLRDAREKDVYSEYLQMFLTKEPLPIIDGKMQISLQSFCKTKTIKSTKQYHFRLMVRFKQMNESEIFSLKFCTSFLLLSVFYLLIFLYVF
ncbi:hypothetical protein FSP39_025284, partial [Pinctada imbricata]